MRPNFFVNTPDILPAYLQYGGPAAFRVRAVLAATLSPTWGVYAGYELYEHVAVRPGSEEYLDSEKYQYRPRDWSAYAPGGPREDESLAPYLARLNAVRREHPALQRLRNLRFHHVGDPDVIAFSKRAQTHDGGDDTVIVVVNLDPHGARETTLSLDMPALGFDWHETFAAHDELSGQTFRWGQHNYLRLDPHVEPAHVVTVRRWSW
jgi:starch synthase (maltosyl-transferring)